MLSACRSSSMEYYTGTKPTLDIKEYFNGPIKAYGIVQDWRGRVTRQFDVQMKGSWDGDIGTLEEDFQYYDGETQKRIWHIRKTADNRYVGTAGDIIGEASGRQNGQAINWDYVMDLPVDDTTYHIRFDDWMWLMNDGVLINRSYLKKFGITVAELTIVMQKQEKK
jgi:hypothetical protein